MLLHVKSLCVLALTIWKLNTCLSDDSIGCGSSQDFQDVVNTEPLDLVFSGEIITYFDVEITSILSTTNNKFDKLYIDARLDDVDGRIDLIIFTTDNFERYVKEQTATQIFLNVNFECSGGTKRTLLFFQPLKDGNYFSPEFSKDIYTLVIPTPLYKSLELTMFEEISARDDDLSDYEITFSSSDSEDFQILVGTLLKRDRKTSFASLELMSILLSLDEKIEFSIIATDNGNPPRSSSPAKVIITADSSNSLPPIPKFVKTVVYGSLTEDLQLPELEIILDPATYSTDVSFRKLSDDEDIFQIKNIENIVYVTLSNDLDQEFIKGRDRLTFDVEASNNRLAESGRTAVSISFPQKKESRFKKGLYEGKINLKSNALEIEDFEVLMDEKDIENLELELQGQYVDLFDIEHNENIVELFLKPGLTVDLWTTINFVSLKLVAKTNLEEIASTNIIIDVIHTTLLFQKPAYIGSINSDGDLVLDPIILLTNTNTMDDVDIQLLETDAKLFSFTKQDNQIVLRLNENLSQTELKNKSYLSLEVEATESTTGVKANCLIFIEMPKAESVAVKFEKNIYEARINDEAKLIAENIVLDKDTYNDEIEFSLLGRDAEYFSIQQNENIITLFLKDNFNISEHFDSNALWVELKALHPEEKLEANCLIFIEMPKVESVAVKFEKSIYEARINDEAKLIAENIVLDKDTYNDEIEFSLLGRDAEYFSIQQNENIITLFLKDNFNISEHFDSNALWVELKALHPEGKLEAFAIIVVDVAHETAPEFEQPNYIAELTQDNILSIQKIELKESTWKNYTLIELKGDYSDFFEYTTFERQIEISLKSELPEEVKEHSSIVLVVIASNNAIKGYTSVVINLPHSRNLSNIFKKTIQHGQILEDESKQLLKIDDIEFVKEYNVADFTCELTGDESKGFDYTAITPKNVLKLVLAAELPNEVMKLKFYITFLLECQHKEDALIFGSTIIFIDLPSSNGQNDCPAPVPPTFIPEFQSTLYNFFAKPTYVGSLQSVHAIIKGSDADVRYSLHVENEHLRSRINIDSISGEIFLSALTSPGRYYFDIVAENVATHSQSQAQGRLDIEALVQCEDHVSVSNSLLIKYLEEEIEHDAILNGKLENCEFYVFSMEPNDQEYVKIDPVTKMLTMIPTNREDTIFSNMILPQIEVKLKLDCSSENMLTRMSNFNYPRRAKRDLKYSRAFAENKSLVLTNDITFAKDVTVLSIILVDINDNRPEFIYPKQEHLVVGFPEGEISMQIFSEYVIQVVALDTDDGLNAKIRYSIQPNEHFQINPTSGKVYPYENAMKETKEIHLIVYATDRDGGSDGLSSKFTMIVKVLTAKHFTLLTFVNENVKSIESLMKDAQNRTGIDFVDVKHATVSTNGGASIDDVSVPRAGSIQFVQKVWTYAFEGEVPIPSSEIKRKLSEGSSDMNIFAQSFEEVLAAAQEVELDGVHNISGYIAGLCVLAVIIVACIGFILWRYLYKSHAHTHDEPCNNLSARGPTNQNFNLKQGAEIDIQKQTEILSDAIYEPSFYSKRESVKILGTTTQESTDDGRRRQIQKLNSNLNGSLAENYDGSESDSSNESMRPRATVTFNELVERIHIESDDDEKNKPK